MVQLSHFELLPLETLEQVFILSYNCDLPLPSRHLKAQLPPDNLKFRLALSMLASDDPNIQNDLLSRRFVDLNLCVPASEYIIPRRPIADKTFRSICKLSSSSYFSFAPGVRLCKRLLHNLHTDGEPLPGPETGAFWELKRVQKEALSGLEEALRAKNEDAVKSIHHGTLPQSDEILRIAIAEMDCVELRNVLRLFIARKSPVTDPVPENWVSKRIEADEEERVAWESRDPINRYAWKGAHKQIKEADRSIDPNKRLAWGWQ
ncbi:MAG: hypothetical protein M1829_001082 [Trizodia sp. TS-e1964]|nr:MAG: hypothetical protein M1829_001082 [Trizodia sp. TS-e1964]